MSMLIVFVAPLSCCSTAKKGPASQPARYNWPCPAKYWDTTVDAGTGIGQMFTKLAKQGRNFFLEKRMHWGRPHGKLQKAFLGKNTEVKKFKRCNIGNSKSFNLTGATSIEQSDLVKAGWFHFTEGLESQTKEFGRYSLENGEPL